jgi:hypothetical protein
VEQQRIVENGQTVCSKLPETVTEICFKPLLVDSLVENMIGDISVFDIQSLPNVYYANSFMSRSGKLCR